MAEHSQTIPVEYHFEKIKPFTGSDWWPAASLGMAAGFVGGIATYNLLIDGAAARHDAAIYNVENKMDTAANPAPYQKQLGYLLDHGVAHVNPAFGYAAGAAEAGVGTLVSAGLLLACRVAAFKARRYRHKKIIEQGLSVLELDQRLRKTSSSL